MKLSEDQTLPYAPQALPPSRPGYLVPRGGTSMMRTDSGELTLKLNALPVSQLAKILQGKMGVGSIVVDKTDLKGLFEIRLQFGPEPRLSATGPGLEILPNPIASPHSIQSRSNSD